MLFLKKNLAINVFHFGTHANVTNANVSEFHNTNKHLSDVILPSIIFVFSANSCGCLNVVYPGCVVSVICL